VSRGAEAPTEPADETKFLSPARKKALAFASAFFKRNKSLSGFVKCPAGVKYAYGA